MDLGKDEFNFIVVACHHLRKQKASLTTLSMRVVHAFRNLINEHALIILICIIMKLLHNVSRDMTKPTK